MSAGFFVFIGGLIVAITGAAKLPPEGGQWPDTWYVFAIGAVVTLVGLLMWRRAIHAERRANASGGGAKADALGLLRDLQEPAQALAGEMEGLDAKSITERVDVLLETYLLPFADVRLTVIDRLGMSKGAEILVTVAYGERMLNRTWSAASDGHLPEARASYPEALAALQEAQRLSTAASD